MTANNAARNIFVDPSSTAYYEDRLFDRSDKVLNRDHTLEPFIRLREAQNLRGNTLRTADYLLKRQDHSAPADYYSLGVLDNYKKLMRRDGVRLRAFVIFEPPVVDPRLYQALPELTEAFDEVYVHNTFGDGYSLQNVRQAKLRKLHWPQPRADAIEAVWQQEPRSNRIVVINGNHKPREHRAELYSQRIEAMVALARSGAVDLYGRGWDKWWSRSSLWRPYWKNRATLMSIYKGACDSKLEILSQYRFCLCFENMAMQGYVTEKIFDCFYAGTIPLYLGATDMPALVPRNAYIDCREFASWEELRGATQEMTQEQIAEMKHAGRTFLQSPEYLMHFNSLLTIFNT